MKKRRKGRHISRHVFRLCLKSRASVKGKQTIWKKKSKALQAGEERRGSCASESNGRSFDPAMVDQLLTMGAAQAMQQLAFIQGEISRVYGGQHQPEPAGAACGRRNKSGKYIGTRRRRQVGGMKALQWILLWILLGDKMPTMEALEEGTALFPCGRRKYDMSSDGQL